MKSAHIRGFGGEGGEWGGREELVGARALGEDEGKSCEIAGLKPLRYRNFFQTVEVSNDRIQLK